MGKLSWEPNQNGKAGHEVFQRTPHPDLLVRHFAGMEDRLLVSVFDTWRARRGAL